MQVDIRKQLREQLRREVYRLLSNALDEPDRIENRHRQYLYRERRKERISLDHDGTSLCGGLPADGAGERIADFRISHAGFAQLGDRFAELAQSPLLQVELAVRLGLAVNVSPAVALGFDDRIPFQQLVSLRDRLAVEIEIVG